MCAAWGGAPATRAIFDMKKKINGPIHLLG
jgi:hypothetical protein